MSNSILDTLNENQRTAATTINEHVRIIAGAGSGKTRVLMARIVYLVQDCGILPNRRQYGKRSPYFNHSLFVRKNA